MATADTLSIRIGSTLETLQLCTPNDEDNPVSISNDFCEAKVLVRVNNFRGKVPDGSIRIQTTPYFEGRRRLMSFQFQARFKRDYSADDLVWSQDWDQPLNAPTMIGLFTKFWKLTDPGSFSELNSQTPYMRSFVATAMCTITAWAPRCPLAEASNEPFRPVLVENIIRLLPDDPMAAITRKPSAPAVATVFSRIASLNLDNPPSGPPSRGSESPSGSATPTVGTMAFQGDAVEENPENTGEDSFGASVSTSSDNQDGAFAGDYGSSTTALINNNSAPNNSDFTTRLPSIASPARPSATEPSSKMSIFPKRTVSSKAMEVSNPNAAGAGASGAKSSANSSVVSKEVKMMENIMSGGEDSVKDRRRYFSVAENRKDTVFKPDLVYGFEVFNPYFDPNEFKIKIPAITIDLHKVTNGQPMRLRLMSKDGSTVFFVVEVSVTPPPVSEDGNAAGEKGTLSKLWGRFTSNN